MEPLAVRKSLTIVEFDDLRERPIKGLNFKANWEDISAAIEKSFVDIDYALDEGESTRMAQDRAVPIIEKLLSEYHGKNIVIGTHGNIMTIIMNYYDPTYGYEFWKSTSKPDIYEMAFEDKQLQGIKRIWK